MGTVRITITGTHSEAKRAPLDYSTANFAAGLRGMGYQVETAVEWGREGPVLTTASVGIGPQPTVTLTPTEAPKPPRKPARKRAKKAE